MTEMDDLYAERNELRATIEHLGTLMNEDYAAGLVLDQGNVLMAAKADGMRLVVARVRAAIEEQL